MSHHVCVKKVTVEYAAGGQRFRVDFEPDKIMAIVFSEIELDRMNTMHAKPKSEGGLGKPDTKVQLVGTQTLAEQLGENDHKPAAKSERINGEASDHGAPLWWYTDANTWFHPQV